MLHARATVIVLALAGILSVSGAARGVEPLRWKFTAGERLKQHLTQETTSAITVSSKTTKTLLEMQVDLAWQIDNVADGAADITQTIDRIQLKLQPVGGEAIEYDSATMTKPVGAAKEVAAIAAPLVGAKFQIRMTDRGEIKSAEPSPEFLALLAKQTSPDAKSLFTPESVRRLLGQTLMILPEKAFAKDATWQDTQEAAGPLGQIKLTADFTAAGAVKRAGEMVEKITCTSTISLPSIKPSVSKIKIKQQSHSGTIYFSAEQGRVIEAEQSQRVVTETPYRDATIIVELDTTLRSTLGPS